MKPSCPSRSLSSPKQVPKRHTARSGSLTQVRCTPVFIGFHPSQLVYFVHPKSPYYISLMSHAHQTRKTVAFLFGLRNTTNAFRGIPKHAFTRWAVSPVLQPVTRTVETRTSLAWLTISCSEPSTKRKGKRVPLNNNYAANTRRSISHFGNAPAHCCEHADGASARVPASSVAEKRCQMPQNQLPGFGLSLASIKSQRFGDAMLKLRMAYDDITNRLLSKHSQHRQSQSLAESHGWGTAKKCEPLVTKGK